MNGSGPTGYTLDSNKMQMVFIDYSWYGAGRIRWGLRLQDGSIQYIHQAPQNNVNTEAYMRSGNIPARFEISSKSKNGKLLASVTTGSSTLTIKESDALFLPTNGTIVVNNEYMEYTKGGTGTTLGFASRTLNINNSIQDFYSADEYYPGIGVRIYSRKKMDEFFEIKREHLGSIILKNI